MANSKGPTILFLSRGWVIFFFMQDFSDLLWLSCFAQNLQTSVTILIYKNFFGPLGYLASAYVMAGPEMYHHLRFGACRSFKMYDTLRDVDYFECIN